ncbi:hypothetical protein Btru_068129 [Bulinus truncatus]|nr:hypothetical protein Btru_068129 [Bulinus truncatus]
MAAAETVETAAAQLLPDKADKHWERRGDNNHWTRAAVGVGVMEAVGVGVVEAVGVGVVEAVGVGVVEAEGLTQRQLSRSPRDQSGGLHHVISSSCLARYDANIEPNLELQNRHGELPGDVSCPVANGFFPLHRFTSTRCYTSLRRLAPYPTHVTTDVSTVFMKSDFDV